MDKKNIQLFKVNVSDSSIDLTVDTLRSGFIATGPKTDLFENKFGDFIGNKNVVAVNCGSSALALALYLSDIKNSDEVICSPLTCAAVTESVFQTKAKIVWADIDIKTGNIDPEDIERKINKNTKAIVYSHWVGRLADINRINQIAKNHGLITIEDAASAIGGEYDSMRVGRHSDFTCFSFQAVKQITTGDGGMLVCKDEATKDRAILLRNHGNDKKAKRSPTTLGFDVLEAGWKYQMNDIAASIGLPQIDNLEDIIKQARNNMDVYNKELAGVSNLVILTDYPLANSNPWVYTVLVENRDAFVELMKENGIGCSVVHMRCDELSIFKEFKTDLPKLDYFYERMINIPVGWWLKEKDIKDICEIIKQGW